MSPLKELRTALGLTQEEFASETCVGQSQISDHERTGRGIGPEGLLRIADRYRVEMNRLGLTVEDLMRGSRARDQFGMTGASPKLGTHFSDELSQQEGCE